MFLGVIVTGTIYVLQCSGPRAELIETRLVEPADEGDSYRIEALVLNPGPGHGEVSLTFRLRGLSGETLQDEQQVSLEPGERALVVAEINAPRARYQPEVELRYPAP